MRSWKVRERGIKLQGRTFVHTASGTPQNIDATLNRPLRATQGLQQHAYACMPHGPAPLDGSVHGFGGRQRVLMN